MSSQKHPSANQTRTDCISSMAFGNAAGWQCQIFTLIATKQATAMSAHFHILGFNHKASVRALLTLFPRSAELACGRLGGVISPSVWRSLMGCAVSRYCADGSSPFPTSFYFWLFVQHTLKEPRSSNANLV